MRCTVRNTRTFGSKHSLPPESLLGPQAAADLLGLKKSTLYAWSYKRRIPAVKIGNRLRFRPSDLAKLVAAGVRPALRPPRNPAPADAEGGAA
jgi:excisionase family DNA binding protein